MVEKRERGSLEERLFSCVGKNVLYVIVNSFKNSFKSILNKTY